ncbi:MAG: putative metal-binding motif-containing protein [Myxococcales bacterium]|nr:putative metal-binding motif-containing protein [Myxococcales bacterium]
MNTGDLANGAQSDICVSSTFFRDADGDDAGVATTTQDGCTAPAGYSPNAGDCDDGNPAVRPGAAEVCNGADDDCDGTADEGPPPCQTGVCVSGACVVDAGTDGGEDSGSGSGGDGGTDPTDAGSADASDGGGDPPVCGCSGAPSAAFWVPALVLLVALRRRTAYDARPGRTGATHLRSPGRR